MSQLKNKLEQLNALFQQAPNGVRAAPISENPSFTSTPLGDAGGQFSPDQDYFDKQGWKAFESLEGWLNKQSLLGQSGGALHWTIDLASFWRDFYKVQDQWQHFSASSSDKYLHRPEENWCFLDIESGGPKGDWIFLIGILRAVKGQWRLEQFFSPQYSDEAHLLTLLESQWPPAPILSTFNGKGFDLPCIDRRAEFYDINLSRQYDHIDLLPLSRRKWRGQFPNCRLQTLEKYVLGRERLGDIPGKDIPKAYHNFVVDPRKSKDQILDIIYHNALDVVSLWELAMALPVKMI